VRAWTRAGARLVGGCCRVGPDLIAELAGRLEEPGEPTQPEKPEKPEGPEK
ncbi:homocysteine S-methyltransferase family protein, partial [Streptomyces sp. 7G]